MVEVNFSCFYFYAKKLCFFIKLWYYNEDELSVEIALIDKENSREDVDIRVAGWKLS